MSWVTEDSNRWGSLLLQWIWVFVNNVWALEFIITFFLHTIEQKGANLKGRNKTFLDAQLDPNISWKFEEVPVFMKFYCCTSNFKPEVVLFDEKRSIKTPAHSVESVMGLAVGHSLQSVFAKATNIKRRKGGKNTPSDQSYRTWSMRRIRVNIYSVILPGCSHQPPL